MEILTKEKTLILHIPKIIQQNQYAQYLTFLPNVIIGFLMIFYASLHDLSKDISFVDELMLKLMKNVFYSIMKDDSYGP